MNLQRSGRICAYGILLTILVLSGCKKKEAETLFTRLLAEETSVEFNNINVENEQVNIFTYEYLYNGSGVAIGDINNDGLSDLYFSSNNLENKLYLNKGNLQFEDITAKSGAACKTGWKTGVSMVDINADGWLDIYVCRSADSNPQNRKNFLLINNHDLTFTDKAHEYGLDDDSYTTQATFFDYDLDGDLDVFMLNHSLLSISNSFNISMLNKKARHAYVGNRFYRNDNGHFRDVSDSAGIYGPSSTYGLGIGVSDLNNDRWPDVYVSNDYVDNDKVYLNNQDGTFRDATDSLLTHTSQFSMGLDIADVNQDGLMDILTLDMLPEDNKRQKLLFGPDRYDIFETSVKNGFYYQYMRNMLQVNNGDGTFTEAGQLAGVSNTDWSWSALFADFDNDGLQDLYISNGYKRDFTNNDFLKYKADQQLKAPGQREKYSEMIKKIPYNRLHSYIFKNTGELSFKNMIDTWGIGEKVLTNGAAYADLDNDGDLDLVMNHMDAPAGIYRNNSEIWANKNAYLRVKLNGMNGNKTGIGAKVTVYSNGRNLTKEMFVVRGFQSSVEPVLHFGLGNNKADSLFIQWPNGGIQKLDNIKPNQVITLSETDAIMVKRRPSPPLIPFFTEEQNAFDFTHKENQFIDFKTQALLPRMYSRQGPALAKGDVNGDGLEDLYAGGAKGQPGELYLQAKEGKFQRKPQTAFANSIDGEAVDALFFDADGDRDLDLYVVNGGYEYEASDKFLADLLYLNDGKGNFSSSQNALPEIYSSGSCVRAGDVDSDGDLDLFVGGRLIPGRYPESPGSSILVNDGKGKFADQTETIGPALKSAGMVTDAVWTDLNRDGKQDLVVVGEWMPVTFLVNENGKLTDQSAAFLKTPSSGWWNCITAADVDKDGDDDLILGNAGTNNQMRPTEKEPVTLVYSDIDKNGSIDPIINYFIQGESYPYPNRDELTDQVPSLKKRFTDYETYSTMKMTSILTADELKNSATLTATRFETTLLINGGNGTFSTGRLPLQAQIAPVFSVLVTDVNADGNPDLVMAGNLSQARVRMGKMTGNYGFVFLGDGKGSFTYLPQRYAGLHLRKDVRHAVLVGDRIIFGVNNAPAVVYKSGKLSGQTLP